MKKKAKGSVLALLIDGNRGIYIPKKFAENYIRWSGVETEDRETLLAGPDHRDYWEAWDSVLSSAKWTAEDGRIYSLYHNDSLWCYREAETRSEQKEIEKFFASNL